jgi:ATP-dependent DNA helicase RecG
MGKPLDTPIQYLKSIGPKRAKTLANIGINNVEELLYYFPRRYEDRRNFIPISKLQEGNTYTIKAKVSSIEERHSYKRRGFSIIEASLSDSSAEISCVWFNQPYLKEYLEIGATLILYGKVEKYAGRLQMNSPEFEAVSSDADESLNIGRITPIYSLPRGFTQRQLRLVVKYALDEYLSGITDPLPYDLRVRCSLLNQAKSLINIHFPDDLDAQNQAYRRISFEEFFLFQLPLVLRKLKKKQRPGIAHQVEGNLVDAFVQSLPFRLTCAQEKVIREIKSDMVKPFCMQRLLQGDVGSGKTVVATIASIIAIQGGHQAAFMAPTEILARQHFDKISLQLAVNGLGLERLRIGLLTSSLNKREKQKIYRGVEEGKIDLIIGTQALIEEPVKFQDLGLIVIDEQHKFGVGQRALLPAKGVNPDILIMTATPIPRTLAITLYGDLDVSIINELPPGRLIVKTMYFAEEQRNMAYKTVKDNLARGFQAYIVYPVIDESYALDIAGAKKMYNELRLGEFKEFRLGLVHGRLKQGQQDDVMSKFKRGEIDVLVSTTVLEVGIDIPNATCMIIESSQRFGLSQLHQLRGRVGRGEEESYCMLICDAKTPEAKARLDAMVKYNDGFRIAEEDLKIRGPGEFFGRRQSGLSELKIANPLTQMQLLKEARDEAIKLTNNDPDLALRANTALRDRLLQRFPEYEKLMITA